MRIEYWSRSASNGMKTIINIQGMHCPSCKLLLEDTCLELPEIQSCNVDYLKGQAEIKHNGPLNLILLKSKIENMGKYVVELPI